MIVSEDRKWASKRDGDGRRGGSEVDGWASETVQGVRWVGSKWASVSIGDERRVG